MLLKNLKKEQRLRVSDEVLRKVFLTEAVKLFKWGAA
jgi:hypothetical protein